MHRSRHVSGRRRDCGAGERYSQRECWEALRALAAFRAARRAARALLQRVLLGENGVAHAPPRARLAWTRRFEIDPDSLAARFLAHAPALAAQAARAALARRPGSTRAESTRVIVSTCTGYLCPGLTSYVVERLGLRADVLRARPGRPGLRRGAAEPAHRATRCSPPARCEHVLSVCVEVCSAAMYLDDDPGVLISACLFGDGAGAAVLSRAAAAAAAHASSGSAARRSSSPREREALRMEQRGGMLRNILTRRVPELAAEHASGVLGTALARAASRAATSRAWIWHAGGRTVLRAPARRIGLDERDTRRSAAMLRDYGNLSSAFVLFVLEAALARAARPAAGGGCRRSAPASAATARCCKVSHGSRARDRVARRAAAAGSARASARARDLRRINALMGNARLHRARTLAAGARASPSSARATAA